jgi:hypothetical protein
LLLRYGSVFQRLAGLLRPMAFIVPGGLGVQEGALLFGHALGVNSELSLAVSIAKRLREVLCGLPALASWQWVEGWRLRQTSLSR